MKTIVEWGHPQHVLKRPCGTSSQIVKANAAQAEFMAKALYFVETGESLAQGTLRPTPQEPRKVLWSKDSRFWVAVSLLDGVPRGAYAALADKEAKKRHDALSGQGTQAQGLNAVTRQEIEQLLAQCERVAQAASSDGCDAPWCITDSSAIEQMLATGRALKAKMELSENPMEH